ncbi:GLPGLI family protein [Epilithonimonas zeae]|uniref:GLPGLI family protein n=1 Tax=Epilithonimonas zeae TaxID=1416779 RepID=UPI00200BFFE2|nr:GLPGLI family protein [Epilithonimonas zeae]UQB69020.1 GLPGLI family protein [Epilithonimonas zeae]
MKTYIILLLIFFTTLSKAQTHRFIYEYKFKPDSTSTNYRNVNMALDINPTDVKFYDYESVLNDSINKKGGRNYNWTGAPVIKRNKNSYQNTNYEMMMDYFSYTTTDKMDWKLENETKPSGQYTLQKATTNFGGRQWIAWFCKDVNISEGPYKFRGLPGLIFEINDSKDNFIFKLIKSQKIEKTFDTSDFMEAFAGKKPLNLKISDMHKMMLQFYNDPMKELREKFDDVPPGTFQVGGKKITSKDQFKEMAKVMQHHILKNYNPLDLTTAVTYPVIN